jgi:hypothetical protein
MMIPDAFLAGLIQASPTVMLALGDLLNGMAGLFGGVILLIIGVLVILFIVAAAIVLLPAILVAFLVWLVTGSFFFAGVSFLVVALLSIVAIADD